MTTPERRQTLYSKMLRFMINNKVNAIPVDLTTLCRTAGVDLVPLSKLLRETDLNPSDVFSLWGNEDGAVHVHNGKHRIAYNDEAPPCRTRFTLCEEIAHIVYGHTQDPNFNMFSQSYNPQKYAQYDEEARLGAGFLICHPRFFYSYEQYLSPESLSTLCDISLSCARARHQIFTKYKEEITSNIAYQFTSIPRTKMNLRKAVGQ